LLSNDERAQKHELGALLWGKRLNDPVLPAGLARAAPARQSPSRLAEPINHGAPEAKLSCAMGIFARN
jgi:hypothetical protein